MVIEWLYGLLTGASSWVASMWPAWTPPAWLTSLPAQWEQLQTQISGIGVWADWTYILTVVTAVLGVWVITLGVKTARALVSYLPFFGGAG